MVFLTGLRHELNHCSEIALKTLGDLSPMLLICPHQERESHMLNCHRSSWHEGLFVLFVPDLTVHGFLDGWWLAEVLSVIVVHSGQPVFRPPLACQTHCGFIAGSGVWRAGAWVLFIQLPSSVMEHGTMKTEVFPLHLLGWLVSWLMGWLMGWYWLVHDPPLP